MTFTLEDGFWNPQVTSPLPQYSFDFEGSSSQYMSMSDANFGAFNRQKFAVSAWIKRESGSGGSNIHWFGQNAAAGNRSVNIMFNSSDAITIDIYSDGTTIVGKLVTTATYTDTTSWHHYYFVYDSTQATGGNRMRLWVDGSEVTSFSTDTNPSLNQSMFDSTADMCWGQGRTGAGTTDGLMYQPTFFSGSYPSISSLYNAGSPMDVAGLSGLYSTLDISGGDLTSDAVLSANWTNNNTVVSSSTIPT
jgi:hypothetical protein